MTPTLRNRVVLLLVLVVAGVGLIESAANRTWDLAVVFALTMALQIVILVSVQWRRQSVALRRDLVEWLEDRAASSGEPVEAVADRCVAAYRASLVGPSDGR